jgi:hypothetical protein
MNSFYALLTKCIIFWQRLVKCGSVNLGEKLAMSRKS